MKKILMILFLLTSSITLANPPAFMQNYDDAMSVSKELHQPSILIFTAEWCLPCKKLKKDLSKYAAKFEDTTIAIIDIDKYPELANKYQVKTIPRSIFFNAKGEKIKDITGYSNIEQFKK